MSHSPPTKSEFEREYDSRWEGLDFDDHDESQRSLPGSQQAATQASADGDDPDEDLVLEAALTRARAEQSAGAAAANPLDVLEHAEALAGMAPPPAAQVKPSVSAELLATAAQRLADALAGNPVLAEGRNPSAAGAALVMSLVPVGTSKTVAQSKLANALGQAKRCAVLADWPALGGSYAPAGPAMGGAQLAGGVQRAQVAAAQASCAPAQAERAVRELLQLASAAVSMDSLGETGAGADIMELAGHAHAAIAGAAALTLAAWKARCTWQIVGSSVQ
jgi:hypothetical protein